MPETARFALITGASSGIGRATALLLARHGFHVVGIARREDRLRELAAEINTINGPHGDFLAIAADVTQAQSMQTAVAQVMARFGRLDILIANAGVGHRGALADAEWDDLQILLRTNIDGVLHSIQAAVPAMRQSGGGHIITISSVAYNLVSPYAAAYAASKAFVTSIAHSLRMELESDGIIVSDLLVGRTDTEFNEKRLGAGKRSSSSIPTMKPEQVAEAILKALSHPKRTVYIRFFDRLLVFGNKLIPDFIGQLAKRQYQ